MILKACKYYRNSRCALKNKFCDLNCNQAFFDQDGGFSDKEDHPLWETGLREGENLSRWTRPKPIY